MRKLLSILFGLFMINSLLLPSITLAQGTSNGNGESTSINLTTQCINGVGKDCFNYEEVIGIKDYSKVNRYSALSIAQDIIYAATYMVGAVLTAVIIWCGLGYILAARGGKDTSEYKKGLKNGAIGAILVMGAYTIVRLIQYIAKGN